IMGGEASGCTEATTDVLIESALWDPKNIARTGRRLGIQSDARYRFERGVDPSLMVPGLELATRTVLDLCGGVASDVVVAGDVPDPAMVIDFPVSEIRRLAGIDPSVSDVATILEDLGFACRVDRVDGNISVSVPSWRPDVAIKADLVEEVVRIIGVDRVPVTPMTRPPGVLKPVLTPIQTRTRQS
ncbi:MAG: phenylalanine--tRNA ligase subunit beta, partial [bacterium]|nr:phenylalanine--tRNA ligase subunit beta [bacterium]